VLNDLVNGGYMVVDKKIFQYIKEDDDVMLVYKTLPLLARKGEVAVYKHSGFWHCMDTYRDYLKLNEIWTSGNVPWKTWK
jgi:glucose-1-phosphate cytidylyltransferase